MTTLVEAPTGFSGRSAAVASPWQVALRFPVATVGWLTFALYAAASVLRFGRMQAGIDLAIFTEAVGRYAHAQMPWSYLKGAWGFNLLGDHFSPAVAVLAPFYRLVPDARVLLVAQAALVAAAAAVLTRAASRALGTVAGIGVGAAYALAWGTQAMAMFDFHEVAFALPLLAAACAALVERRERHAVLWALPLMLVKEDSVFLLLGLALVLGSRRRWGLAAALATYGVASFAVIVGVFIPAIGYYGTYTYWAAAAHGGAGGALATLAASVWSGKAVVLVVTLLAPSGGLALRSPLALAVLPSLATRLTSPNQTYWGLSFHYNATATVVLAFAFLDALQRRSGVGRTDAVRLLAIWAAAGAVLVSWWLPLGALGHDLTHGCRACGPTRAALAAVPDGASVAADDTLASYLVDHAHVHELKPDLRDTSGRPIYPKFIAMDRAKDAIWDYPQRIDGWREQLMRRHAYGRTYDFVLEQVRGRVTATHPDYDIAILTTNYPTSPQ